MIKIDGDIVDIHNNTPHLTLYNSYFLIFLASFYLFTIFSIPTQLPLLGIQEFKLKRFARNLKIATSFGLSLSH